MQFQREKAPFLILKQSSKSAEEGATVAKKEKPITALSIAKDALKMLNAKTLMAESGTYLHIPDSWSTDQIQPFLLEKAPLRPCKVCALGAVFCGLIKTVNEVNYGQAGQPGYMRGVLGPYFNEYELIRIEKCFEGWDQYRNWRDKLGLVKDKNALRYILRNIIQGGGKFDPKRLVVKRKTKGAV